jgi:hypothetical protein
MSGASEYAPTDEVLAPSAKVLKAWLNGPGMVSQNGKPADIWYSKGKKSFCELMRKCASDVTPVSMLKVLVSQGLVRKLHSGKLRLDIPGILRLNDRSVRLVEFDGQLGKFAGQLDRKLMSQDEELFIDYVTVEGLSPALSSVFARTFSERARDLLVAVPKWVEAHKTNERARNEASSMGVGVYLFGGAARTLEKPTGDSRTIVGKRTLKRKNNRRPLPTPRAKRA